jgi:hypothetical protein
MPAVIPLLGTIFSIVGGGVGAGEAIANAVSGPPSVSQPPNVPTNAPPKIAPSTVSAANSSTAADIQARGGGGLSPLFTQLIEGQPIPDSSGGGGGVPYTG